MDTKRSFLLASVVASVLFSGIAQAQTIFKQVDEDGRVTFTDQPRASARTVASYESGPSTATPGYAATSESPSLAARRPVSQLAEDEPKVSEVGYRQYSDRQYTEPTRELIWTNASQNEFAQNQFGGLRGHGGEVERAVSTYTALTSPLAIQADAYEAARRAMQARSRNTERAAAAKVLVVQPIAPDSHKLAPQRNMDFFYTLWVLTFFILAGGLLYFGWRVLELILGRAFPTWDVGAG